MTSIPLVAARASGRFLGCALPMVLAGCLLTAPPPEPPPPAPPPGAGPPVSTMPTPAPAPRRPPPPDGGFAEPPPVNPTPRPGPPSRGAISPASARTGAMVAILGNFQVATSVPREVQVWFAGAGPVTPGSVRADRVVVQVPSTARTGPVRMTLRRRVLWTGNFTVLASTPPPPTPTIDCRSPPSRVCCMAMTEGCRACARRAEAERRAWERKCRPKPPPAVDCSKSPPRRACCKALTPACTECQKRATEENRRWDEACLRR